MQIWTNFLILFNLSFLYESRNNDTYTKIVAKINETISIKLLYGWVPGKHSTTIFYS